jgi:hypothetical protein
MRDPIIYRKFAEECRKLALSMPQHNIILLQMSEAWTACAEAAEKHQAEGKTQSGN